MRRVATAVILMVLWSCEFSEQTDTIDSQENQEFVYELGQNLFEARWLSRDSSISCASCHIPKYAFADTLKTSQGIHGQSGFRNTPSLYNVGFKSHFFSEGGVESLERATIAPILVEEEMHVQAPELLDRIYSNDSVYSRFKAAFGDSLNYRQVISTLVVFQQGLQSLDAYYDEVENGNQSPSELWSRGRDLFFSEELKCAECHPPPFFRDSSFHDIGLPLAEEPDYGRGRLTFDTADYYTFSTPSLRNVSLSAPYMHDGSIATLDSVLGFYEQGGVRAGELKAFQLSVEDRAAILEFLNSLTGAGAEERWRVEN